MTKTIDFDGESYFLKSSVSLPGEATSELREYLPAGEDWEGYRKMIALRLYTVDAGADVLAKATVNQTLEDFPGSFANEIELTEAASTIRLLILAGENVELSLWRYVSVEGGIASAQFVMRNKPPYETQASFKAEQEARWDEWLQGIVTLSEQAAALIAATAGAGAAEQELV